MGSPDGQDDASAATTVVAGRNHADRLGLSRARPAFTVLHVVRNMGGGLAGAISDYAASVPEARHVVLCDLEPDFQIAPQPAMPETYFMPRGFTRATATIRAVAAQVRPDVVHAHSSFAGLYVRAGLPRQLLGRVVYTPHCYAFFRRDVSTMTRSLYWAAEAALTARSPVVAACSPQEAAAAARLPRSHPVYVPNIGPRPPTTPHSTEPGGPPGASAHRPRVVTAGRMCPQKDPLLFVEAALAARRAGLPHDWLWIGGGDSRFEKVFQRNGIGYTGWVPRESALRQLSSAAVYVHTAAWEGAPLSVLESASLGVPVLGRAGEALAGLGLAPLWRDVDELVRMLSTGPDSGPLRLARATTASLRARHTRPLQRAALLRAYAVALRSSPAHGAPSLPTAVR